MDKDTDEHTKPGIARPGDQADQQQQPNAPPQNDQRRPNPSSTQWTPPSTGNPDLDPAGLHQQRRIDLSDSRNNPLTPQGMLFDPSQLIDLQRHPRQPDLSVPPGARFDPYGPPDPTQVGPHRGPLPESTQFGVPDPDHLPPPGMPQMGGKSLKSPWQAPRGPHFPPPGGAGGSPFL